MKFPITAALVLLPIIAQAGTPITTQLTCSIGGEKFEITETASCSMNGERRMSFAPTSSCDFITRLPQCPGNFLPMYRDFSEEELTLLRDYMQSESYESNVDGSRYYLAYIIEKYLADNPSQAFWILLSGLWYDSAIAFENQRFMEAFFFEAIGELGRVTAEDLPFAQAVIAYAYVRNGQNGKAQELLDLAKKSGISEGILPAYITQIEGCIASPEQANCAPDSMVNMH